MDDALANATIHGECRVLGIRLRPLSLWHVHLLEALESPLAPGGGVSVFQWLESLIVSGEEERVYEQLRQAVAVCSSAYDPAVRCLEIKGWRERRRVRKYAPRVMAELEVFWRYRAAGVSGPEVSRQTGKGVKMRRLGCPRAFGLYCRLRQIFGLSESEAWDTPFAKADWMDAAIRERAGEMRIIDDRLRAVFDQASAGGQKGGSQ